MSIKAADGQQSGTIDTKEKHHMAAKKPPAGKADAPEGTPASTDGKPNEDEITRRREEKARASEATTKRTGSSLSERLDAGEGDDGDQPEMFPLGQLDGDSKVSLKNLIKAGAKVKVKASLSKAAVPITGGGLFDPEEEIQLLVRGLPGGVSPVPTHEEKNGKHPVKEWTLTQDIRVTHVQAAGAMYTREQVLELFNEAGVSSAVIGRLLGEEPASAQA